MNLITYLKWRLRKARAMARVGWQTGLEGGSYFLLATRLERIARSRMGKRRRK